MSQVVRNMLFK